jgi:DNA-binding transcriptional MerR regulator
MNGSANGDGSAPGYVRIGELSRRTGVSPELLRAWESRYGLLRPNRSSGGFRLYSDEDEARVLRMKELTQGGVAAAEAARLALEPGGPEATATPLLEDLIAQLTAALDGYDADAAHEAFDGLLSAFSVESVLRDAVLPYLARLGERWERGEISVAHEHFASALIRGRLLGLARGWGAGRGPSLLLACPPGEEHDLPLIVFGLTAARRGWRIVYLGADTPFDALEATALDLRPALVVLSVSMPGRLRPHAERIRSLAGTVPVAVGGSPGDGEIDGLPVRLLEGDPVSAARDMSI